MSPLPSRDSSNSLVSLGGKSTKSIHSRCGSKETVITLADVRSLDDLSLGDDDDTYDQINNNYDPICRQVTETQANSLCQWADRSQTLIFLDWDDTLFPTTEIVDRWGFTSQNAGWAGMTLSDEQERLLDKWRSALELYLKTTCSLSNRCVIVTNARRPWVTDCIDHFAPCLKTLLDRDDGPRIVYANEAAARSGHRPTRAGNPARWTDTVTPDERRLELTSGKLAAMRQEAKRFYSQYPNQTWKNVISVGDARYEREAAQEMAFTRKAPARERLRLKTILTQEEPALRDLTYRLRLATLLFPAYVHVDGDMSIDLNVCPEKEFADALNMPELHNLIRRSPISEEDEKALADEFDEVVMAVHDHVYQ